MEDKGGSTGFHRGAGLHLDEDSMEALRRIFALAEVWGRYPAQLENKLVKLIGKKDGGLRPIVLFRSLFRVHARARQGEVRKWEQEHAGDAKFNSAPRRRINDDMYRIWLRRCINDEKITTEVLWDLKKAFENVDMGKR